MVNFSAVVGAVGAVLMATMPAVAAAAIDDEMLQAPDAFQVRAFPGEPDPDSRPIPGGSPIVQCDAREKQLLDLQRLVISPNPPVRGENLTITAEGVVGAKIEDGAYVDVDVRYGFIKLVSETFDLCSEITKVDMECPIDKGRQKLTKEVEIPQEVPPGKYYVVARAYTKDDDFITCLNAVVEFPPYGAATIAYNGGVPEQAVLELAE
ncbi:phosphatidylglycerol/phosphatidylinositol transfer protein [Diutina catenulata]